MSQKRDSLPCDFNQVYRVPIRVLRLRFACTVADSLDLSPHQACGAELGNNAIQVVHADCHEAVASTLTVLDDVKPSAFGDSPHRLSLVGDDVRVPTEQAAIPAQRGPKGGNTN